MSIYLDKACQCEILTDNNSISNDSTLVISDDKDRRLSSLLNMFGIKCQSLSSKDLTKSNNNEYSVYRKVTPTNTPSPHSLRKILPSPRHLETTYKKNDNSILTSPRPPQPPPYPLSLKPTLPKVIQEPGERVTWDIKELDTPTPPVDYQHPWL